MKVNKLTPNLAVKDVKVSVVFYQETLGFSLVMAVPESQDGIEQSLNADKTYVYALLKKDDIELMFQRSDSFLHDVSLAKFDEPGASVSFYMEVDAVEVFYHQLKDRGVEVSELKTAWYGMKEFYVNDPDGYILGFAEKA